MPRPAPVRVEQLTWSPDGASLVLTGSTSVPACAGCDHGSADPVLRSTRLEGSAPAQLRTAGGFAGAGVAFPPTSPDPASTTGRASRAGTGTSTPDRPGRWPSQRHDLTVVLDVRVIGGRAPVSSTAFPGPTVAHRDRPGGHVREVVVYHPLSLDGVAEEPSDWMDDSGEAVFDNLAAVISTQDTVLLGRGTPTPPSTDERARAQLSRGPSDACCEPEQTPRDPAPRPPGPARRSAGGRPARPAPGSRPSCRRPPGRTPTAAGGATPR